MSAAKSLGRMGIFMKRFICAALFFAACDIEPATTNPDTYADFLKLSSQLSCEASLRCCGTACTPTTDFKFYQPNARALAYLDAGLFNYDRQAAISCLDAMKQRYTRCDAAINDLPSNGVCGNLLTPNAPVGGVCDTIRNTCAAGNQCGTSSCTYREPADSSCEPNTVFCTSDQDSCCTYCTGLCYAALAVGATCTPGNTQPTCKVGAYCSSTQRCTLYAELGQACSEASQPCNPKSGLVCLPGDSQCGLPQPNGSTCINASHCASGYCKLPNFLMLTQGTCQTMPAPITVREQLCQGK